MCNETIIKSVGVETTGMEQELQFQQQPSVRHVKICGTKGGRGCHRKLE